ncbi:transposase [Streptosporangium violaceochromogenes]|nr:transposase [Streptosporangium violaceochromogenes]
MTMALQRIQQAFKYALDPTPAQARMLTSHAGAARYAFNWGLATFATALDAYSAEKTAGVKKPVTKLPGHFDLCKLWTAHKDNPTSDLGWVGQNFSGTYQAALRDAHAAWKAFLDSKNGRRRGRQVGRPRFKSRHRTTAAFQTHGTGLRVADHRHINLPKIGPVRSYEKTKKLRRLLTRPDVTCTTCDGTKEAPAPAPATKSCGDCKGTGHAPHTRIVRGNITRTPSGRWHISLTVETHRDIRTRPSQRQREGGIVGVDWGVRDLATLSTGEVIGNPRHLERNLARLRRAQQDLARKADGSAGREAARLRVARLHGRVANLRRDHLEKVTSRLVHSHTRIVVEGWDVQHAMQHSGDGAPKWVRRDRNRALSDTGIGAARWMLGRKAAWYGSAIVETGPHEPTGRTCSACATARTKPVAPADERFTCPSCGYSGDRRVNTARVLVRLAHTSDAPSSGESLNARGGDVRPAAPSTRPGGQTPTRPSGHIAVHALGKDEEGRDKGKDKEFRGRRSPMKREARSRPPGRGKAGTPDP